MNIKIKKRENEKSYKNFNVAVYCPVENINHITDFEAFDKQFSLLHENIKIGRVYLECYRDMHFCDKEQLIRVKKYFEGKGIQTSGGITTNDDSKGEGYLSLCYSSEKGQKILRDAVRLNAEVFDELILDDFYFTNCRCKACIENKGNRSWSEFRLEQKKWVTEEIIMKTAKEVNPDMNVIIKYPQWYEYYEETGYCLTTEPAIFDSIYTGTESRNPSYSQQHLPKYISYFTMRYLESAAPNRNLGGWFDPYECSYNLTSYLEQCYLTVFGKAKEVTLFCMDSLMKNEMYQQFVPALGYVFEELDRYMGALGNPVGAYAYRPAYGRGEDYLHNYLGMCGIALEPTMVYPESAKTVFLDEAAADDKTILDKMHDSLLNGTDVVVTSGFVRKMGDAFVNKFVNVTYSARKAFVNQYGSTVDNGLSLCGNYTGKKKIMIPQLDYCTNDIWELAAAYDDYNNFPIVLRCKYGEAQISIITIPDNMGDLYNYPAQVLSTIRRLFEKEVPVQLEGPAEAMLFVYDNKTMIVRSDLPYDEIFGLIVPKDTKQIRNLVNGSILPVKDGKVSIRLVPSVNYVFVME